MMGTPENDRPEFFYHVNQEEAVGKIVGIIREFRPTAIVTFDPSGGYGHPDHITISNWPQWLSTLPRTLTPIQKRIAMADVSPVLHGLPALAHGEARRISDKTGEVSGLGDFDPEQFGLDDKEITSEIDVRDWTDLKAKSLDMHRTQMNPDFPFNKLPPEMESTLRSTEHFALVKGVPLPDTPEGRQDLFAGLR